MINVALLCTKVSPALRPTMSSVVSMREGRTIIQEVVSDTREVLDDKKYEIMRQYYQNRGENNLIDSQAYALLTDTGSSGGEIRKLENLER